MLPAAQLVALFSSRFSPPFLAQLPAKNPHSSLPLRYPYISNQSLAPSPGSQDDHISLRHSGRITKSTPIILLGCDAEGRVFSEETRTVILSFHGAGILSAHKLVSEQEMTLRSLVTLREAEIRVIGEIAKQDDFHVYGVAFLDDSLNFWQEHFLPPPENAGRPLLLSLECSHCHVPVTLKNGEFESDICAIHGGLIRYCDDCGYSTIWKPSIDTPFPSALKPALATKAQFRPTSVALLESEFVPESITASVPELPERPSD
jgi:hypothetical protein